ncbi:hypothetical protein KFE25_011349 [Diacronema lutheri]|uniref:BSD domain-containing protein n=1 Tax=Diacronema lutheri TaxID=2081491 RepID=A0A8J5XAM3_DIALT|nr:hypothetical protein KFE25_011349 [Diacronema lutheri]
METKPEEFLAELAGRFAKLPEGESLQLLLSLSQSDDSFLTLDKGETTKTFPAIQRRFATLWPEEHALSSPTAIGLVTAARKRDRLLQKRVDRLVPKKVTERAFWRHYFSRVHAVLVAHEPSTGDKLACHIDALPKPRPLEERRFPPAPTLQTEGEIDRARMIELLIGMTRMVTSEESLQIVSRAAADGAGDVGNVMLAHQLEFMESRGIDRSLGVTLMSPHVLQQRFPSDEQLFKMMGSFMTNCNQAAQIALHTALQRAPADPQMRKFKPAAELQRDGTLSDERLRELIEATDAIVADSALHAELVELMRSTGHSADAILIRWQREYLESVGLEQDFGVAQLRRLPLRYQTERAARLAAAPAADVAPSSGGGAAAAAVPELDESALGMAFGALRLMADKLEHLGREATIEVTRPTPKEIALRRFKPANVEGGEALQSSGSLTREQVMRFTTEAARWLLERESIEMLARVDDATRGPLSVSWQREYLEHLGVEQDFGCRQLALVPERFKGDEGLLKAFAAFQAACMASMKMSAARRAELEKEKQAGGPAPEAAPAAAARDANGVPHAD